MTSYLFIVNPHARNKEVGKKWSKVEKEIKNRKMDYSVEFTTHPKHAIEIAKDQARNFDCVIAAGGDGTSHEVANGIYGIDVSFGTLALGLCTPSSSNSNSLTTGGRCAQARRLQP